MDKGCRRRHGSCGSPRAITGRRTRAIRRICLGDKTSEAELLARLQDPFLKISVSIQMAVVLGVVFLMVARPGLAGSLGMVGTFIALGLACGLLMSRRAMPLPALSGRDQH